MQLFQDRVFKLSSRSLRDSRIDEDILYMPNPAKHYFFIKRDLTFKQGILKSTQEITIKLKKPPLPQNKSLLTLNRRHLILEDSPNCYLDNSKESSLLKKRIIEKTNLSSIQTQIPSHPNFIRVVSRSNKEQSSSIERKSESSPNEIKKFIQSTRRQTRLDEPKELSSPKSSSLILPVLNRKKTLSLTPNKTKFMKR